MLYTEYGFAMLKHGSPDEMEKGLHILTETCEKFQVMGAEGYVDFIQDKLKRIGNIEV